MLPYSPCSENGCVAQQPKVIRFRKKRTELSVWELTRGIKFWRRVAGPHSQDTPGHHHRARPGNAPTKSELDGLWTNYCQPLAGGGHQVTAWPQSDFLAANRVVKTHNASPHTKKICLPSIYKRRAGIPVQRAKLNETRRAVAERCTSFVRSATLRLAAGWVSNLALQRKNPSYQKQATGILMIVSTSPSRGVYTASIRRS